MPHITIYETRAGLGCAFDGNQAPDSSDWEERIRVSKETLDRLQIGTLQEVNEILTHLSTRVLHVEEHGIDPASVNIDGLKRIFSRR